MLLLVDLFLLPLELIGFSERRDGDSGDDHNRRQGDGWERRAADVTRYRCDHSKAS